MQDMINHPSFFCNFIFLHFQDQVNINFDKKLCTEICKLNDSLGVYPIYMRNEIYFFLFLDNFQSSLLLSLSLMEWLMRCPRQNLSIGILQILKSSEHNLNALQITFCCFSSDKKKTMAMIMGKISIFITKWSTKQRIKHWSNVSWRNSRPHAKPPVNLS